MRGGPGFSAVGGWVELRGIDPTQSLGVDIGDFYSQTFDNPGSEVTVGYVTGLAGGDQISIRQPANGHKADVVLTLAAPTIDAAGGAVFGSVPDGTTGTVVTDGTCGRERETHSGIAPGPFSFPDADSDPGVFQTVVVTDAVENTTSLTSAAAGETPCFQVNASSAPRSFEVAATHLTGTTLDTSRLVVLRDGLKLLDELGDGTGVGGTPSQALRAGDELVLYTPAGELDPTYTMLLPDVSGSFDTLTDLVSVTAPAASSIHVDPSPGVNFRQLRDVAAGESTFDFAVPGDGFPATQLAGATGVAVEFTNLAHTLDYVVDAGRVDPPPAPPASPTGPLQAAAVQPTFKLTVPSSIRASALKLKLACAGEWKFNLVLAFPATRSSRAVKLATVGGSGACSSRTLRLAKSKRGARALKSLSRARGATLTIRADGPDGRRVRATRKIKLRP